MKEHQYEKKKTMNQSKYTLKKNVNYLPQMILQTKSITNRSKDEAYLVKANRLKNKTNDKIDRDLNLFYNKLNQRNTSQRSTELNFTLINRDSKSIENKSTFIMKKQKEMPKVSNTFLSLRDKGIMPIKYKTGNNSLIKDNNKSTHYNNKLNLKQKKSIYPYQLKISLNNNTKPLKGKALKNNPLFIQTKYIPTSFITFSTQPSSTVNKANHNQGMKYKNSQRSLNEQIHQKNDISNQIVYKDTLSLGNEEDHWRKDPYSNHKQQRESSDKSNISGALEYDEVKDIIMYNDFAKVNYFTDYLFNEGDYEQYYNKTKDTYLNYFINAKDYSTSNSNKHCNESYLLSKSIPIVKLTI